MKVLAPYELERLSRLFQQTKARLSAWSVLVFAELVSQTESGAEWHRARDIVAAVDIDWSRKDCSYLVRTLVEMSLIDIKRVESVGSRFDTVLIRVKSSLTIITCPIDSYDGALSQLLLVRTKRYMHQYRRTSPAIILALTAIFVRKIAYSGEFYQYIASGGNSRKTLLDNLSALGMIYQVKISDASKTGTLIYPVDDLLIE